MTFKSLAKFTQRQSPLSKRLFKAVFYSSQGINQGLYWLDKSIGWGLSEGNPETVSDLKFLKTKAKVRFKALIFKLRNPGADAADAAGAAAAPAVPPDSSSGPPADSSSGQGGDSISQARSKRATSGQRMSALIGEEAEADNEFWGQDAWNADDVDEEFSGEDAQEKLDIFDSDFNDSEDANDEVYDDEGVDKKRKSAVQKTGGGGKRGRGAASRDSYELKAKARQQKLLKKLDQQKGQQSGKIGGKRVIDKATQAAINAAKNADRSKRASTKQKTETAEMARVANRTQMQYSKRKIKKEITRHSQEELLQEAIQTEVIVI